MRDGTTTEQPQGYALWAVFAPAEAGAPAPGEADSSCFEKGLVGWADRGVTLRGLYDVSGMRADAELMLWLHGPELEELQAALRGLRRCAPLRGRPLAWSATGAHRAAEFSRDHVPAFLRGEQPRAWLCVYPFVRSYEWYLLPPEERGGMLREHGLKGREHAGVLSNTVSSFGLGDYEWVLALEADDPLELVDLMRDIRATEARRHVRLETPFYTGRALTPAEAVAEFAR